MKRKVVVIGLDGSTWDVVQPMIDAGRLPNLKKMMDGGSHGMMRSTNPAHSAPAWTTFATGVAPTEHGCLDFLTVNKNIDDLKLIDSSQIPQETIYEMMMRHGRKPILINLPNTYPAKLETPTITSLMTRGEDYIFPTSLVEKYPKLKDYRLSPNPTLRMKDNFDPYVKDVAELERKRIAGAKELFSNEDWDFFFYLSSGTDWVSHVVYDKALLENYDPALQVWEIMDEFIGWTMNNADEDTNIIVMSDHGFKVYDKLFFVNRWLEKQGYLATKPGKGTFHQDHTQLSKEISKAQKKRKQFKVGATVRNILGVSPTVERIAKWIYFKIVKKFIPITVTFDVQLDLEHTQVAFPRGSMATMLYINDLGRFSKGTVPADERSALAKKVKQELTDLKDKAGNPVLASVSTKDELYGAKGISTAPDLFLEPGEYYLSGSMHSSSLYEDTRKNYHDDRGMFLAYGPDIQNKKLPELDIHQMAPTVMQALQLPHQQQFRTSSADIFSTDGPLAQSVATEDLSEHHAVDSLLDDLDI